MTQAPVIFYVSGHGLGHIFRMAEIVNALAAQGVPSLTRKLGPPVVESADALRIDGDATLAHWHAELAEHSGIIEREAAFVRSSGARLIIADIPYLAGPISRNAGIPAIGISNFTWNWVFEPLFDGTANGRAVLAAIEAGYQQFTALWQLPFQQPAADGLFAEVVTTPLVVSRSARPRQDIREVLEVDSRPMIFVAFRGQIPSNAFRAAANSMPEMLFVTQRAEHATGIPNARLAVLSPSLTFQDIADASDVVISKLGYGLVASCIASKTRFLYVPRTGFREDGITSAQAPRHTCLRELPTTAFLSGDWKEPLQALLDEAMPEEYLQSNGAEVCASRIIDRIR